MIASSVENGWALLEYLLVHARIVALGVRRTIVPSVETGLGRAAYQQYSAGIVDLEVGVTAAQFARKIQKMMEKNISEDV